MTKTFWSRIGELWCTLMHPAPMWPSHGYYRCAVCLRTHPVPWEAKARVAVPHSMRAEAVPAEGRG